VARGIAYCGWGRLGFLLMSYVMAHGGFVLSRERRSLERIEACKWRG
jgi:hypothetical protein